MGDAGIFEFFEIDERSKDERFRARFDRLDLQIAVNFETNGLPTMRALCFDSHR